MMQTCINNLQNFKFTIVVSVFHFDSIYEHTVYKPFHMHDINQNKNEMERNTCQTHVLTAKA